MAWFRLHIGARPFIDAAAARGDNSGGEGSRSGIVAVRLRANTAAICMHIEVARWRDMRWRARRATRRCAASGVSDADDTMLWLCIHLPELPLEALALPPEMAVGVVEIRGHRRQLIRISQGARARGLYEGISAAAALSLAPDIRLVDRNPAAEQQALEAVACWAYRFGAPVTLSRETGSVWVEVRRSLRMYGGWRLFRLEIEREGIALSYGVAYGVAPTRPAAELLARAGAGLDRPIGRMGDLPLSLRDKAIALLPFDPQTIDILYGSGLRTVGAVLDVPRDSIARRFGTDTARWLDRLIGQGPDVWDAFEPPAQYRRRFELAGLVDSTEALLFPLRAMIGDFSQYLRARDVAVQTFRIVFLDGARRPVALDIGLLAPTRDPVRLLLVLRERLDKLVVDEGVLEIKLEADHFEAASIVQDDLFQTGRGREDRAALYERLHARLGAQAIRRLAVAPDNRPEKAWSEKPVAGAAAEYPPRPLWLLPQPEPIAEPVLISPPERIECGWWDGVQQQRDYFIAEDRDGRRLWVYKDANTEGWWLHGLWQ